MRLENIGGMDDAAQLRAQLAPRFDSLSDA
jgi:hypothetical protein